MDQDYPHARMQVLVVVDSASTDATDAEAKAALDASDFGAWEVIRNTDGGGTPANLNVGLAAATGTVLCRVDARSRIPPDYVRRCVEILTARPDVSVVGGSQVAIATGDDARSFGIARALNNRWGMGLSRYRRGAGSGPSDTVYLGAFRTAELRAVGGWNREFATNQDFELNRRMAEQGLVWFEAGLPVGYVPRPDLRSLHRQYRRFGAWKVRYWRRTGDRPRPRQLALLVGVPAAVTAALAGVVATRGARRAGLVAGLVAAAVFVEGRGSPGPGGGARVHAWSFAALVTVAAGWLEGAWQALIAGERAL
jgi:glycosyltransferase involved in cell wall biosynthesis